MLNHLYFMIRIVQSELVIKLLVYSYLLCIFCCNSVKFVRGQKKIKKEIKIKDELASAPKQIFVALSLRTDNEKKNQNIIIYNHYSINFRGFEFLADTVN